MMTNSSHKHFPGHYTYTTEYDLSDLNFTGIPCPRYSWYSYYVGGIATTSLCSFAIFGNIICLIVLSRPVMKSSVNFILLVLSASDLVQVVSILLMRGVQRIFERHCTGHQYSLWFQPIVTPYLFPVGTTAQVASVYLTVLVSLERYVAVCMPFKARVWFSRRQSALFCLSVFFFSALYNLPTWFELDTCAKFFEGTFLGLTARRTSLYLDSTYVFYYVNLGSFVVIRLVPFVLLVILNTFIWRAIQQMNRARKTMTHFQCHEVTIARMLLCIVVIFLACNLVTIVSHMLEAFEIYQPPELPSASNFLILLNSAVNFIIYCFLSRNFRKVLLRLLGSTWDRHDFRGRMQQPTRSTILQSLITTLRERRLGRRTTAGEEVAC